MYVFFVPKIIFIGFWYGFEIKTLHFIMFLFKIIWLSIRKSLERFFIEFCLLNNAFWYWQLCLHDYYCTIVGEGGKLVLPNGFAMICRIPIVIHVTKSQITAMYTVSQLASDTHNCKHASRRFDLSLLIFFKCDIKILSLK